MLHYKAFAKSITFSVITLSDFHCTRICLKNFCNFFLKSNPKISFWIQQIFVPKQTKLCHLVLVKLCFSEIIRTVITLFSRCYHEHLDLFTEIRRPDVTSLIETPFGGRYCGKIPPRSVS